MDSIKQRLYRDRYKLLVIIVLAGIMLLTMVKTLRHPVSDLVGTSVRGYGLSFLKPVTIALFGILIIGFLFLCYRIKRLKVEQIFLFMGILFGVLYMVVLPPFTTPDEAVHVDTSYYYSSKILGQQAVDENGYVLYRSDDALYNHDDQHIPTVQSYAILYHNLFKMDHSDETVNFLRAPLSVSAIAYVPQIIGVTLARLFHLGNIQMLLWGRMFAMAFYLLCLYWAIKIAPIGKELLMVVALMPTTLQMAVSFSYDSTVLALCFLYTGVLLYLTLEAKRVTWHHIVLLALLFAWAAPAKLVYICLAFTLLIIPTEKFANKYFKYISIAGIILAGAVVILLTRFQTVVAIGASDGGMLAEQTTYSLSYLLHNPSKILAIFYGTIIGQGTYYLETMIGQYLGWLEIILPGYIVYGFYTLIILSAIRKVSEKHVLSAGQRLWIFLVIAGVSVLVGAALLFDWTPIESNYVYGVQGRYFLPMLPLLMILCKNYQIEMKESMTRYIAVALYVLQYLTVYHVYVTIIGR